MNLHKHTENYCRIAITIRGAVQGVGFRPFVYKLATQMQIAGWIINASEGVTIEAEGSKEILDQFLLRLQKEIPPLAFIQSLEFSFLDSVGLGKFEIRKSDSQGKKTTLVLPDIATCPECLNDVFDSSNRRYLYPFTNCTHCGPRYSIIEKVPYDRINTSMKLFEMCPECQAEYKNPLDRRFHAQPNACPACGPRLQMWDDCGNVLSEYHDALLEAVRVIREGKIAAVKGLGGFHLIVDACNDDAVLRLRERKHREEKPFALMFPSLENIRMECYVNEFEQRLLQSPESPIVLLQKKYSDPSNSISCISQFIAPHNPYIGAMLPYTPLHHLLLHELGTPVVATSGNLSDEPICIDEHEALDRLHGIADFYLVHNRPIMRHVDDSICRIVLDRELVLRRARGYAPLPIAVEAHLTVPLLAVGGHLKNAIAVTSGSNIFISQHIGDLETLQSLDAFHDVVKNFQAMFDCRPSTIACDIHPDYLSSKFARSLDISTVEVQHHYAHIVSCMAENKLDGELLGIAWDGTGLGTDGTIWGGEFLLTTKKSFNRVAAFRPFRLPGGEKAVREPCRAAIGILYELFGNELFQQKNMSLLHEFTPTELDLINQMLIKQFNTPLTSSVGRIFDAVASMIGLRQFASYEGQAAMELEFLTTDMDRTEYYLFEIKEGPSFLTVDWQLMIEGILFDKKSGILHSTISTKFHNTLVEMILVVAKKIGTPRIVLSGGCFQNRYLTERAVTRLQQEGFRTYWHQRVPPNDGGIALGQAYAVLRSLDPNGA